MGDGMTNPWEENWRITGDDPSMPDILVSVGGVADGLTLANARLIAAAPALYRALAAVEWEGFVDYDEFGCTTCGAYKDAHGDRPPMTHKPDCALNAALKSAQGIP